MEKSEKSDDTGNDYVLQIRDSTGVSKRIKDGDGTKEVKNRQSQ